MLQMTLSELTKEGFIYQELDDKDPSIYHIGSRLEYLSQAYGGHIDDKTEYVSMLVTEGGKKYEIINAYLYAGTERAEVPNRPYRVALDEAFRIVGSEEVVWKKLN